MSRGFFDFSARDRIRAKTRDGASAKSRARPRDGASAKSRARPRACMHELYFFYLIALHSRDVAIGKIERKGNGAIAWGIAECLVDFGKNDLTLRMRHDGPLFPLYTTCGILRGSVLKWKHRQIRNRGSGLVHSAIDCYIVFAGTRLICP